MLVRKCKAGQLSRQIRVHSGIPQRLAKLLESRQIAEAGQARQHPIVRTGQNVKDMLQRLGRAFQNIRQCPDMAFGKAAPFLEPLNEPRLFSLQACRFGSYF